MFAGLGPKRDCLLEVERECAIRGEVAAVGCLPIVVLLGMDCADESECRIIVGGEHADDVGAQLGFPRGSSPVTDERWSSASVTIFHDESDRSRSEKLMQAVALDPEEAASLRVCTCNAGGVGNCGRCEKCVRTMLPLAIAGRMADVPALPPRLPRRPGRRLHVACDPPGAWSDRAFLDEMAQIAATSRRDRRMLRLVGRRRCASDAADLTRRVGPTGLPVALALLAAPLPRRAAWRLKGPLRPLWNRRGRLQTPIRRLLGCEIIGSSAPW